jgi:outer membrane protein assembly factor BamD (BamD/ComL family)
MGIARIYRRPVESARHEQFKMLCVQYFTAMEKLIERPSRRYAEQARKALIKIKKAAHYRGMELLELYAPSKNKGREPINGRS